MDPPKLTATEFVVASEIAFAFSVACKVTELPAPSSSISASDTTAKTSLSIEFSALAAAIEIAIAAPGVKPAAKATEFESTFALASALSFEVTSRSPPVNETVDCVSLDSIVVSIWLYAEAPAPAPAPAVVPTAAATVLASMLALTLSVDSAEITTSPLALIVVSRTMAEIPAGPSESPFTSVPPIRLSANATPIDAATPVPPPPAALTL